LTVQAPSHSLNTDGIDDISNSDGVIVHDSFIETGTRTFTSKSYLAKSVLCLN